LVTLNLFMFISWSSQSWSFCSPSNIIILTIPNLLLTFWSLSYLIPIHSLLLEIF
jgi:hypothetical protein